MRTNHWILLSVMVATGCSYQASTGKRGGETRAAHAGTVSVVFTNASPDKVCGLRMSFDGEGAHGDNWLPAEGLPSGQSATFRVKPGKYKATWNTCTSTSQPYFAATLVGDWAFEVKDATQLFAYVADTVAPTKRGALKDFHKLVKFPGQKIDPTAAATAVVATEEANGHANPNDPNARTAPATEAFDAKDWIEKPRKRSRQAGKIKPSLDRAVDVGGSKVKYAARQ